MTSHYRPRKPNPGEDIFEICPVTRAFEIIGSKWRLTVLRSLDLFGEQRFSELQETTTTDSSTLARVLADLEDHDLISRRVEEKPIASYYALSEKGESLSGVFEEFEKWAFEHTASEMPGLELSE